MLIDRESVTSKLVAAWVEKATMEKLLKLKQYERETLEDVIARLIRDHLRYENLYIVKKEKK